MSDKKKGSAGTANELSLANVGGVFVVLLFGVGLACIIAVLEFIWKTRRVAEDERVSDFLVINFFNLRFPSSLRCCITSFHRNLCAQK